MTISDQTFLIGVAIALNYATVYQKNKLIGGIIFLLVGGFSLITNGTHPMIAMVIIGTALISIAYDLIPSRK